MICTVKIPFALLCGLCQVHSQIQGINFLLRQKFQQVIPGLVLVILECIRKEFAFEVLFYRRQDEIKRDIQGLHIVCKRSDRVTQVDFQGLIGGIGKRRIPIVEHIVFHPNGLVKRVPSADPGKQPVEVDEITSHP